MKNVRRDSPDDFPRRSAARRPAMPKEAAGPKGQPVSEPLRQEAERGWAKSDQAADKDKQRSKSRGQASTKRRQLSRRKDEQIVRLTGKLQQAERELVQQRRRRRKDE